jgi:hypothetical protein
MKKASCLLYLFCLVCAIAGAEVKKKSMITRDQLVEMFANIKEKTKWDMDGKMVWGYFFTNATREPLVAASKDLEKQGFRVVQVYQTEERKEWWLHVEKVESHSVDSLHSRNQELYKFADEKKLGSYDGMDVGPIKNEKKG